MTRLLGVLALGFLVANEARGDIAPPKGLKRVTVDVKITTEKDYADLAFYSIAGRDKVEPVKLDPKTPAVLKGTGRAGPFRLVQLVAVPKDAAKKYDSEKAFHEAIVAGKVEGQVKSKTSFSSLTTIKDTDTRTVVVEEYKLEKIDPKDGLVFASDKKEEPKSSPPRKDGEEEEEGETTAYAPKGGVWIAGLAATAALISAGLWLARRSR
jgi:hypothetical protein